MLYSCGNVIGLGLVHFIDNWFMMILVAVYVYLKINAIESPCRVVPLCVCGGRLGCIACVFVGGGGGLPLVPGHLVGVCGGV